MTDTATRAGSPAAPGQPPPSIPPDGVGDGRWFIAMFLGAAALVALLFFGFIAVALAVSDPAAPAAATTVDLTLSEFAIEGNLTAPAGDVNLNITNIGSATHNIVLRDLALTSGDIASGGNGSLALGKLDAGTYQVFCSIPGHEASGMVADLVITADGAAAPAAAAGTGHSATAAGGTSAEEYAKMDADMMATIAAFPAKTEGKGNSILQPTEVQADGTKVFDLTASIIDWEVEPGKIVKAWAYNNQVPGPQILLDRGDKVKVRVVNNLPMATDIHWHGLRTANDQDGVAPVTQDPIAPNGGTFEYHFEATDDAIAMYHAHMHGETEVTNGLFGTVRIGDNPVPRGQTISGVTIPTDLKLTQDFPMVLNDAGVIGLSLNGKGFPATEPIVANQGDWISITYFNEGLLIHPMHLHQFPQLVYAKDGIPLDHPYWTDTLAVAPGERYTVLFKTDEPGTWVWHCHILNHVEREAGMFGMVTAVVVKETPGFDRATRVTPSNFEWTPMDATSDKAAAAVGQTGTKSGS